MDNLEQMRSDGLSDKSVTSDTVGNVTAPSDRWGVDQIDRVWKIVLLGGLFMVMFRAELTSLFRSWSTPNESHGILIPAFSLYFLYQKREALKQIKGRPSLVGLLLILVSFLGYVMSIFYQIGYPRPLMMIACIGGLVLFLGGWRVIRYTWLPVLFLIFAIPLPSGIHEGITLPMRNLASAVAAFILNLLPGVECESSYVVITGTYFGEPLELNVADACSGMRLLRAFVALGVAMAYLEHRPMVFRLILVASTIPIAVFCNLVRVLLTGLIYIYIGEEYATGTLHSMLGLVMLIVAFGIYGGIAWILNHLFVEENADGTDDVLITKKQV